MRLFLLIVNFVALLALVVAGKVQYQSTYSSEDHVAIVLIFGVAALIALFNVAYINATPAVPVFDRLARFRKAWKESKANTTQPH